MPGPPLSTHCQKLIRHVRRRVGRQPQPIDPRAVIGLQSQVQGTECRGRPGHPDDLKLAGVGPAERPEWRQAFDASADRMVLVRDAFACKPAVAAETDDYVAVSSEFRSLAPSAGASPSVWQR